MPLDPWPVFVVGLPRSGTSLVEQILAAHPKIHGAGELRGVSRIFQALPNLVGLIAGDSFDAVRFLVLLPPKRRPGSTSSDCTHWRRLKQSVSSTSYPTTSASLA